MDDRQDVEFGRRFDAVDNQVWQTGDLELARVHHLAGMAEQRKLLKHHHGLTNAGDDSLGGEIVVGCNPGAD